MKDVGDLNIADPDAAARAADLRRRIKEAGYTIAEFRRRSGLTRNVVYALTMGRRMKPDEERSVDSALRR